jgi:hypothetical protein
MLALYRAAGIALLLCSCDGQARAASSAIDGVVKEISPQRIEARVRKLVSFGTRHSLSETTSETHGIGAAQRWITHELEQCAHANGSQLQISLDEFTAASNARIPKPTPMVNIVATLPGRQRESRDRMYVVSAHYDSMPSDVMDATSDAPGANDDASGTAAVMELACVMSKYRFDATVVFLIVSGEEQGLVGSAHWVKQARANEFDIAGMFSNDIIGSSRGADGKSRADRVRLFSEGVPPFKELPEDLRTRITTGGESDSPSRELARFVKHQAERLVKGMHVDLVNRRDRYLRGGDQLSFLDEGYPAVRFVEASENFLHQHQNVRVQNKVQYGDLPQFVDASYIASIARLNAAALAALASGPAAPADVMLETLKLENDTTLRWRANSEPDLTGYRIVWRDTTAPYWQYSRDTGNVTRFTLTGISKDDFVFGVLAIDKEGNESIATFPKPYRPSTPR